MKSYKETSFQDRVGRAAEAKQKALDQLRAKTPVDPAVQAERNAARIAREAAQAEKRAAQAAAKAEAKSEREAKAAEAKAASAKPAVTDEDRKAARDARYAARKSRK